MKRALYILVLLVFSISGKTQNPNGNYNPYVNAGIISPSPLWPVEADGTGEISFNIGNSGSDDLLVYPDQYITLTITLSYGLPDNTDPISAIGGTFASLFSWRYNAGTYSATQVSELPSGSSGTIRIAYKVDENSASPGLNGFNVNISPAPYQTDSNSQDDDAVSSYTYTEIRDYGDAPESYGSAWHILDFENFLGSLLDGDLVDLASEFADADDLSADADEDGVEFPELMPLGEIVNIPITVSGLGRINVWFDWNADGDFNDQNERVADNVPRFAGTEDLQISIPSDALIAVPVFARFRFSPGTLNDYEGKAVGGEVEDYLVRLTASPHAPSIPGNFMLDSFDIDFVSMSWTASVDDKAVAYYRIYRDGVFIDSTSALDFTDSTVSLGERYVFAVSAVDSDGYESGLSDIFSVDIVDLISPSVPLGLNGVVLSDSVLILTWNASIDNVAVQEYNIYRDDSFLASTIDRTYTDQTIEVGNIYTYAVSAVDISGNESSISEKVTLDIADVLAPDSPMGLSADCATDSGLKLCWYPSKDNVGVDGYNLYKDGFLYQTVIDTFMLDTSIKFGNTYSYNVSAFDAAGNESELSMPLSITVSGLEGFLVSQMKLSPNPTEGKFVIEIAGASGKFLMELVSSAGNIVIQDVLDINENAPFVSFNFSYLEVGLYNIRLVNDERVYYGKLLIVR